MPFPLPGAQCLRILLNSCIAAPSRSNKCLGASTLRGHEVVYISSLSPSHSFPSHEPVKKTTKHTSLSSLPCSPMDVDRELSTQQPYL